MSVNDRKLINEYKNYLIKNTENSISINQNIKSIDDIRNYYNEALLQLNILEELDKEYKLYDKNYEEFRLSMGKLALGLSKSFKLKINHKDKNELSSEFIKLNNKFEALFQKNIIKDVYVWK